MGRSDREHRSASQQRVFEVKTYYTMNLIIPASCEHSSEWKNPPDSSEDHPLKVDVFLAVVGRSYWSTLMSRRRLPAIRWQVLGGLATAQLMFLNEVEQYY
jgi:hypothetical protein